MLKIVRGRSWSFDATIFDTYVAEGDLGNVPTNHTGWTIRSQIRKKVGNVLVANLNVTFPVPTAGTVAIRHDRVFTRSLPIGSFWWDVVATDPSGIDHVYVEPEPIEVHDHPTDPANSTYDFVPGGGGAIYHTHSISDITGLQALLDDRLPPDGGTIARYLRGDNTWQLLNKSAVGLPLVENVTLSTWGGSPAIVQVGTISQGVWQGTRIAPGYLGDGAAIETKFLRGDGTWQTIDSTVTTAINSETTSDGTADLSVLNITAETAEITESATIESLSCQEFDAGNANFQASALGNVTFGSSASVNFNATTYNYTIGGAAAAAHRTALGVGTADSPTFGGADFLTSTTTTLNVYNILSGDNFERLSFRWASNVARIGTAKGGTGSARDLVLETDGTERVRVSAAGSVAVTGAITSASGTVGNWTLSADILATTPGGSVQVSGVGSFRFGGSGERIYNSGSAIKIRNAANSADAALTCSNLTASGDIEATDSTKGIILKSPNGNRWRFTVDNAGALTPTAL